LFFLLLDCKEVRSKKLGEPQAAVVARLIR
jgi:hypothetical protein